MRALWLEDRALRLRDDLPRPVAPPGEALLRLLSAGICNTDLELVRGYYPFTGVLGHEFVAEVEEARDAPDWVGRRVVGEINASCGTCAACLRGLRTHCERRTVLGIKGRQGALAERFLLPIVNLHAVPDDVPDEVAVFTEPVAAALAIQDQVAIGPGTRVVVVGDGKLGSLIAQTLVPTGCALTVLGRHPSKLALLALRGITTVETGTALVPRADVVVECTGTPEGFSTARSLVRPRGTLVVKSTYAGALTLDMSSLVVDEITLVGSRCGPFGPALATLAAGRLEVGAMISARYPLSAALNAMAHAARRGVLKVLVTPDA